MKKLKRNSELDDWPRDGYARADPGPIVRGKYAKRIAAEPNVVVIEPESAKFFPNEAAVNAALRGLIQFAQAAVSPARSRAKFAQVVQSEAAQ